MTGFVWLPNQVRVHKRTIAKSIIANTLSDELVKITINDKNRKEYQFVEDGREFIHKGNFYDVVKTDNLLDSLHTSVYLAFPDNKEDEFHALINRVLIDSSINSDDESSTAQNSIVKIKFSAEWWVNNSLEPQLTPVSCDIFKQRTPSLTETIQDSCVNELIKPPRVG